MPLPRRRVGPGGVGHRRRTYSSNAPRPLGTTFRGTRHRDLARGKDTQQHQPPSSPPTGRDAFARVIDPRSAPRRQPGRSCHPVPRPQSRRLPPVPPMAGHRPVVIRTHSENVLPESPPRPGLHHDAREEISVLALTVVGRWQEVTGHHQVLTLRDSRRAEQVCPCCLCVPLLNPPTGRGRCRSVRPAHRRSLPPQEHPRSASSQIRVSDPAINGRVARACGTCWGPAEEQRCHPWDVPVFQHR